MRSRWLNTKSRAAATDFCRGATVIAYHNLIATGVGGARLNYSSQIPFNALLHFLALRRRGLVLRRECLLNGRRAALEQPSECESQRKSPD